MSNTKDVSQKKSSGKCAEFLFEYIMGIWDGESEEKRAEIEVPPGRTFCVALTIPRINADSEAKLYNSFRAEGENAPLLFCRYMGKNILTVLECHGDEEIRKLAQSAEEKSGIGQFTVYECDLPGCRLYGAYERLENQLERVFYAEDGENTVKASYERNNRCFGGKVTLEAIAKGDVKNTGLYVESLFRLIGCVQPSVEYIKQYLIRLYADMLIQNLQHNSADMIKSVVQIASAQNLSEAKEIFEGAARKLAALNIPENGQAYSTLVRETIHIINENIENEELSLRWIAGNILYTNVDYLGKIFKKETGKNFSHYVMEKRMEAAKTLILEGGSYKIYEVAESVGFGSNSQYFSQVFKKYTGVSPLEYREYAKKLRRKDTSDK